jgi:hypothetical protein
MIAGNMRLLVRRLVTDLLFFVMFDEHVAIAIRLKEAEERLVSDRAIIRRHRDRYGGAV